MNKMTRLPLAIVACLLAAALPGGAARAAEVTLYLMEVPPLTINEPGRKGIAGDLALAAIKRAGYTARIVVVPSVRAMALVRSSLMRDVLIIPLARQKEREANYTWIAPIARVNRTFFSLDNKVASFDEARSVFHLVGVARGTAGVNILREQGFAERQIYEINDNEAGARMLMAHRFDAWYGPTLQFREWLRESDPPHRVLAGAPLGSTFNYMACSRICDAAMVARLADAVDKLMRDGTAKAIEARYSRSN
jgi:polar amino acid transport system substrate-binding protein